MTQPAGPPEESAVSATETVTQLTTQVQVLRTELGKLQRHLIEVRENIRREKVTQIVEANGHLVRAALAAQAAMDMANADLERLTRLSQRDGLTDTPNRTLMLDRLQSAISMAQRRSTLAAVFFLDVDHFKTINDTLGHAVGDAVLQLVARRLESSVRDSDAVGRHGGDEFLVLLAEVSKVTDTTAIAEKMLLDIAAPVMIGGHALQLSVSVGIALYPSDSEDAATLIALADAAMYLSKRKGGGGYSFHAQD
jgi:diguanylate cyclase (GGDEF)-like protein